MDVNGRNGGEDMKPHRNEDPNYTSKMPKKPKQKKKKKKAAAVFDEDPMPLYGRELLENLYEDENKEEFI